MESSARPDRSDNNVVLALAPGSEGTTRHRNYTFYDPGLGHGNPGPRSYRVGRMLSVLGLGVVKFDVAFSGFADDTPWFLMGAILFGTMARNPDLPSDSPISSRSA